MKFSPEIGDAAGFLDLANDLLASTVRMYDPEELVLVRIDSRFDWKWRRFKGKRFGAFGVHGKTPLVIPPFHPNRVVQERHLVRQADGGYEEKSNQRPLHIKITSEQATRRSVERLPAATVLAWISGDSEQSGHGAAMMYAAKPLREHGMKHGVWSSWHASFVRTGETWALNRTDGLSKPEVEAMLRPVAD